ncbi:Ig-like domain-containing protein [Thermodesulfobacteriota bacterium]
MGLNANKKCRLLTFALLLISITALTTGCGGGGDDGNVPPPAADTTDPTASESPAGFSTIGSNTAIVITFSETIGTSTLVLGGAMGNEDDGGVWSQTSVTDDTLTISPATSWTDGAADLTVDANDLSGNSLATMNLSYTVDATLPTGTEAPSSGTTTNSSQQIVITFSEAMDSSTLVLGGTMNTDSDGGAWSKVNFTDDTLTISPSTNWSSGAQTLTVDADDLFGNAVSTLNLNYTVDTTPPAGNENPSSGTNISSSGQIVIFFTESMDTSTLVIGGSMESEGDGGIWSENNVPDDTLTIGPASAWTGGAATLTVDADDLIGNTLPTMNLSYTVAIPNPSVDSTYPANGGNLPKTQTITIRFSKSMDTGSLSLGGTLILDSSTTNWSQNVSPDDTLELTPVSKWTQHPTTTLMVDADDLFSNPLTQLNLSYTLATDILYVSVNHGSSNDANIGDSEDWPKATIGSAISAAVAPAEIRVGAGFYDNENITLKEAVSLKGGYHSTTFSYNPAIYTTFIRDLSSSGGSSGNPTRAIYGGSGITSSTVVENFTIKGGTGDYTSGILLVGASPTISNNEIFGGRAATETYGIYNSSGSAPVISNNSLITGDDFGSTNTDSVGIYNTGSSPDISNNDIRGGMSTNSSTGIENVSSSAPTITGNIIDGGTGNNFSWGVRNTGSSSATLDSNTIDGGDSSTGSSIGLYIATSSPAVYNNTIFGGTGANSRGITTDTSSATVRNNTINGGSGGTSSHAIYLYAGSTLTITNNILFNSGSGTGYCIYETASDADPASVRNNDFYFCVTGLYYDEFLTNITGLSTSLSTGEGSETLTTWNNVAANPAFTDEDGSGNSIANMTDNDWTLNASSPASVTGGSLNLSAYFTYDKDGTTRTIPWSIGAYEY